jgi:hypothetical protein
VDDRVGLTRADLRYLMRQYADAPRSRREAALHYAYPITMVLALGLSGVAIARDWPVAACYAGLLVPMAVGQVGRVHEPRWRRERFAFYCPGCRENLVPARAELTMATGRCPACGHEVFAS